MFLVFHQSPILLSVDVIQTHEAIESVSLLIDGNFGEDLTKYDPSMSTLVIVQFKDSTFSDPRNIQVLFYL